MSVRSPTRIVPTLLALTLALGGSPARAQTPADTPTAPAPPALCDDDLVNLKDGSMLRGKLLEVLTNDSVTIASAVTGEHRTFPWAEVTSYERGGEKFPIPAPAPEPPPPPELEPELLPGPGTPRLHIAPDRPVDLELFEITAEVVATDEDTSIRGIAYRPICTAPCDKVLDGRRGQSFFFGGKGLTNSPRFTLAGHTGELVANVKPGRRNLRFGGLIALSLGAAGIATGGLLFAFVDRVGPPPEFDSEGKELLMKPFKPNYAPMTTILLSGVALLVSGVVMYVLGRTTYNLTPRRTAQRRLLRPG